jgi:hypothetical protein
MGAFSLTVRAFLVVCAAHCVARVAHITLPPVHLGVHKTPLYEAVERGDLERVQQLLSTRACDVDEGATVGPLGVVGSETPLFLAVDRRHAAIVEALLAAGAAVNAGGFSGPLGVLATVTPLCVAAHNSDVAIVKALLKAGAAVDAGSVAGPFGMLISLTPLGGTVASNVDVAIVTAVGGGGC